MKKLLVILLGIALVLPLYSQEAEFGTYDNRKEKNSEEESDAKPEKKKKDYSRKIFEAGFDAGIGINNGLIGLGDIFRKNIELDLEKIAKDVPDNGVRVSFAPSVDFFANVMNIHIGKGLWNFGFIIGIDGNISLNISKSLVTLISEGNYNKHDSSGKIGGSGGIFTEIGIRSSAKYQLSEKTLYVGVKPAIFTPAVYMPSSAGITYDLRTKNEEEQEGIFIKTGGEIEIYTPTSLENIEAGRFIVGPSGFDLSMEGEYALFSFLDIGGFARIPVVPATLTDRMKVGLKDDINITIIGSGLIAGDVPEIPDIDFGEPVYDKKEIKVHRPFRFDVYARYKPFKSEFLVLRPNVGFSVNVNKGDMEGFFNAGLEARLNLINMFIFSLSSGYRETIWRHRIGLAMNFRAFELDLKAALRDHTFKGCFMGRGCEFSIGMRFGW